MQLNVGSTDRLIRIIVGAALVLLPFLGIVSSTSATLGIVLMVVGVILIVTGFVSFCPIYRILGKSTKT